MKDKPTCKICSKPTNGSQTCSKECLSKLRSINSSRAKKAGKIKSMK